MERSLYLLAEVMNEPEMNSPCGDDGNDSFAVLSEWVRVVKKHLESGETVEFTPKGFSMWPTLRPAKDTVYVKSCASYSKMDIVLAVADNPKGVFLHRIVGIKPGGGYILMGDSNLFQEESCTVRGVLGKVVGIRRGGRDVTKSILNRLLCGAHRASPGLRRLFVRAINFTRK